MYNTIPSLPSTRLTKRQVLVAGAIGVGLRLLASMLFKDLKQEQIIAELARTQNAVNMLNQDSITFQEQQIIWDNELINNIKNTSDRIYR